MFGEDETLPQEAIIRPPQPHLEVIAHSLAIQTTLEKPVFHMLVEGLSPETLYNFELWIYIPSDFSGNHVSLVLWGSLSEEYNQIDMIRRDVWQHLFVKGRPVGDKARLVPSLLANASTKTEFYSSGWRLTVDESHPAYIPGADLADSDNRTLGYFFNNGGLNNQKAALNGLLVAAYATKQPFFLPDMYNLDHAEGCDGPISFEDVYQLDLFTKFAEKYGIAIVDRPENFFTDDPHGWKFFRGNPTFHTPPDFGLDFSKCLIPHIKNTEMFRNLADEVFVRRNVKVGLQLRIEKDWANHASGILKQTIEEKEDYYIPYLEIFAKIKNTLSDIANSIYVICDEGGLPVSKEEIRDVVKSQFGFNLFWKSDFLRQLNVGDLSVLELSLLDFEMAIKAEYFVGLTRSTFSNRVTWEKYCRDGSDVKTHYIYNNPDTVLAQRSDNGVFPDPRRAAGDLNVSSFGS